MPRFQAALPCVLLALAGCASLQSSDSFLGVITPYRVEVVQGNVITREQASAVKPGMTRAQVRDILGSPLLSYSFEAYEVTDQITMAMDISRAIKKS
jgi:outer membrane protein assembly factor BamE (lipoprotein component of BamABCDE complex)